MSTQSALSLTPYGQMTGATGSSDALGGNSILRSKSRNLQRQLLSEEIAKMQSGQLGLTESEKNQMADDAQRAASQQAGAQTAEMNRQTMGNPLQSGAKVRAAGQIASTAAGAGATARRQADDISRQMEERRVAEINAGLAAETLSNQKAKEFWAQQAINAVESAATAGLIGGGSVTADGSVVGEGALNRSLSGAA